MKSLGYFKKLLLMPVVGFSLLSSPANAVSEKEVKEYWGKDCEIEPNTLKNLVALNDAQWRQFQTIAQSLGTPDIEEYYRTKIINALATMPLTKLFDTRFIGTVKMLNEGGENADCGKIIEALAEITTDRLFDERFLSIVKILQKYSPNSRELSLARGLSNALARWALPQSSARIEECNARYGQHMVIVPFSLITVLGNIPSEKVDRVYGNIVRLMNNTEDRIWFKRYEPAFEYVIQLVKIDTDERAAAFTTALIDCVNDDQDNIEDNSFLTHMDIAWNRVRDASQNELRELAGQRQSTHKKEVHASVAGSIARLQVKYKDHLPVDDIFKLVYASIMSVFPDNMETFLKDAVADAKKLVDSKAIEDLLKISPHDRAGEEDEDTTLNVAARALWKDKSEAQAAIQAVVRLHSQMNYLTDVGNLLTTLKRNSDFEDGISKIGYDPLLRLIYAAITDESWGNSQDIPGRWKVLMARISRAQNEYSPEDQACLAGIFNALLEPLSNVHPDVLIVMSFRAMIQEASLEEDDERFESRIRLVLSYLGENAANDPDYKADIENAKIARAERHDQGGKLLEKLKADLAGLNDLTDEDFEKKVQDLVNLLPKTLLDQSRLWKSVVAQARKARTGERELNTQTVRTQPRGLSSELLQEDTTEDH